MAILVSTGEILLNFCKNRSLGFHNEHLWRNIIHILLYLDSQSLLKIRYVLLLIVLDLLTCIYNFFFGSVELEKQSFCDLKVTNNTDQNVAFKVTLNIVIAVTISSVAAICPYG